MLFFKERHEKIAHVQYFCRGSDTVLGELSDKKELFALDDCEDVQLFELMRKVRYSRMNSMPFYILFAVISIRIRSLLPRSGLWVP